MAFHNIFSPTSYYIYLTKKSISYIVLYYNVSIGEKKMNSLYIVMPAYNEEANIEEVIASWYPVLSDKCPNSKLVVADSGSSDNTHQILINLTKKYDKLEVISNTAKEHGPKVIALYDYAIKNKIDYVFQTDSDGQTNPEEFQHFWDCRKDYDGIFGNRPKRGDGFSRLLVEKVVCIILKLYFNVNIPDANAPFRLMNTTVLEKYLYKLSPTHALPNIVISMYYSYYKEKCTYKTITFKPRQGGNNSINLPKIFSFGVQALKDFKLIKKEMNLNKKEI